MVFTLQEKRRFPRFGLRMPLSFQIKGRPQSNNVVSKDISLGGISFINEDFIAPKTSLILQINLASRILTSYGRIAWASPLPRSNRYKVGVEFLEFAPKAKDILQDYIEMRAQVV